MALVRVLPVLASVIVAPLAAAAPLAHQVRLLDALGGPIEGAVDVTVRLMPNPVPVGGEAPCHTQALGSVPFRDGYATLHLDPPAACFSGPVYVEVAVGTPPVPLAPRTVVSDVPSAVVARGVLLDAGPGAAGCAVAGTVAFDTSEGTLRVCDGSRWVYLRAASAIGASRYEPAASCTAVFALDPSAPDGTYWIAPTGSPFDAVEVHCTRDGSGDVVVWAPFEATAPPLHYWDFDTLDAGGFPDRVGSNPMTLVGNAAHAPQGGVIGGAIAIPDTTSWGASALDYDTVLDGAAPRTIAAWFLLDSFTGNGDGYAPVFNFGSTEAGNCTGSSFAVVVHNGTPTFVGCFNDFAAPSGVTTGVWHHLAATYDGTTVTLYVDGAPAVSQAMALNTRGTFRKYVVGVDSWWQTLGHKFADGRIDEVRVYDYVLTDAQIAALYDVGRVLVSP